MIPLKGWRLAVAALLALGALILVSVVIYRVFVAPGNAKVEAAAAKTDAAVSRGETNKAADARAITESTHETLRTVERTTITNERLIRAAPGASDQVTGDLDRAGRGALCLRYAYRSDPACQQLPGADPSGVDAADTGRGPTG